MTLFESRAPAPARDRWDAPPLGRPRPTRFGALVPDDGARRRPARGPRPAPGRRRRPAPPPEPTWRQLARQAAPEIARRAAARRAARSAAPRPPRRWRASTPELTLVWRWWQAQSGRFRVASTAVVAAAFVTGIVLGSPLLRVQRVTVEGAGALPLSSVLAAAGVHRGESMLRVNAGAVAQRLEALGPVRSATVTVRWPSSLLIRVRLWTPALAYVHAGQTALLAVSGVPLVSAAADPGLAAHLPRVLDLRSGAGARPGRPVILAPLARALPLLARAFPRAYGIRVREFVITPAGTLDIYTGAGWVAQLGFVLTPAQVARLGTALETLSAVRRDGVNLASPHLAAINLIDPTQAAVVYGHPPALPSATPPSLVAGAAIVAGPTPVPSPQPSATAAPTPSPSPSAAAAPTPHPSPRASATAAPTAAGSPT